MQWLIVLSILFSFFAHADEEETYVDNTISYDGVEQVDTTEEQEAINQVMSSSRPKYPTREERDIPSTDTTMGEAHVFVPALGDEVPADMDVERDEIQHQIDMAQNQEMEE